jgi:glycosyltransferase involved in cell wall biosynthesis
MKIVSIIQPYIPVYRLQFFQELITLAEAKNIKIFVIYGSPSGNEAGRLDSGKNRLPMALLGSFIYLKSTNSKILNREIRFLHIPKFVLNSDLIIIEQGNRNILTQLRLLVGQSRRIALWGHGKNYIHKRSLIESWIRKWSIRKSIWFFSYTHGGAEFVSSIGVDHSRISVVNNSVGKSLEGSPSRIPMEASQLDKIEPELFKIVFIGALDETKRLKFLFESILILSTLSINVELHVFGEGVEREHWERKFSQFGQIKFKGRAGADEKLWISANCDFIVNPGRVGLVALDSFQMGVPIITDSNYRHAPEFDYLVNGYNCLISHSLTVEEFAKFLLSALRNPEQRSRLSIGCRESELKFSLNQMVTNFLEGIQGALKIEL